MNERIMEELDLVDTLAKRLKDYADQLADRTIRVSADEWIYMVPLAKRAGRLAEAVRILLEALDEVEEYCRGDMAVSLWVGSQKKRVSKILCESVPEEDSPCG